MPEPAAPAAELPPAPPVAAASAADPAFLADWPRDTRLTYRLSGNYRGELHGSARVLWQRTGTRYQAVVEMDAGLLALAGLQQPGRDRRRRAAPRGLRGNRARRRRGVRLGDELRLNDGTSAPRPPGVQDTASQFVERLGYRFATGQVQPAPGVRIRFALARPGGVDEWIYDVVGEETVQLPRLGPVAAWHLKRAGWTSRAAR